MYFYGFYKSIDTESLLEAARDRESRLVFEDKTKRNLAWLMLTDFGRSDVQAILLYKITTPASDYQYAWGRTYLGGLASIVPRAIWPDRPYTKIMEATEALRGRGSYIPFVAQTNIVFGLAGEAMLNFGPAGVPLAFILLGFIVGKTRALIKNLQSPDSRRLLLPILVVACFVTLIADSDNLFPFLFRFSTMPFLLIRLSSNIMPVKGI
jgi:hypothetical protein